MLLLRKVGAIMRGKATPFQVFIACVLGSLLGFMPGFVQAPGLIAVLTILLVLLNASLPLAALAGMVSKLAALAAAPVVFGVGRFVLDGPLGAVSGWMINAPVLAWFGFDYYLTSGGLVCGAVVGVVLGGAAVAGLTAFRKKMQQLERDSERWREFTSKGWVKAVSWTLAGSGKGKATYEELLKRRVGNPIRPLGGLLALLVAVLMTVAYLSASGPIVTMAVQRGLEQANGATVDLESAELDLNRARLTIRGLAMADAKDLEYDLIRAEQVEADWNTRDLLRKRVRLDRVLVSDAVHGAKRIRPGKRIGPAPVEKAPVEKAPNEKTVEDYIREAKEWKERLAQVREWLEKVSGEGKGGEAEGEGPGAEKGGKRESLEERLRREVQEKGYAQVRASHLVAGAPAVTITELKAAKVKVPQLPGETVDLEARHLSTDPRMLREAPEIRIRSSGETLLFHLVAAERSAGGGDNRLDFACRNLAADKVGESLRIAGEKLMEGGMVDLVMRGPWRLGGGVQLDFPLEVTLRNSHVLAPGGKRVLVDELRHSMGLKGALDNPRIDVREKEFAKALAGLAVASAKEEAKTRLAEKAGKELEKRIGSRQAGGLLRGLLKREDE